MRYLDSPRRIVCGLPLDAEFASSRYSRGLQTLCPPHLKWSRDYPDIHRVEWDSLRHQCLKHLVRYMPGASTLKLSRALR